MLTVSALGGWARVGGWSSASGGNACVTGAWGSAPLLRHVGEHVVAARGASLVVGSFRRRDASACTVLIGLQSALQSTYSSQSRLNCVVHLSLAERKRTKASATGSKDFIDDEGLLENN